MLSSRHRALIVDPDPEETAVLEGQCTSQGYEGAIERSIAGALSEKKTKAFCLPNTVTVLAAAVWPPSACLT